MGYTESVDPITTRPQDSSTLMDSRLGKIMSQKKKTCWMETFPDLKLSKNYSFHLVIKMLLLDANVVRVLEFRATKEPNIS